MSRREGGGNRCRSFFDEFPIGSLPAGDYGFKAFLSTKGESNPRPHVVPFTIQPPSERAAQASAP